MGKKAQESEASSKETFEPVPVEGKTAATVVLLLNSPEEDVVIKACEAIHAYAEKGDENKASLLGLGALGPLCQLITHNNKLLRRNAFMALGIMAADGEVKNALKKFDVIPSIIDKLSPEEDAVIHEFATLCLASLSVDFVCKVQIFDSKGLPPLIHLLSSPDPDVQKNSLEIIFNLVQDYKSRQAAHELDGIPPLLELLKSDFPVIQHLALKTLQAVTADKDARNTFREQQGFEKLMDILSNADFRDLHNEALEVVSNCLNDGETLQLIHSDGGLTKLMEFVLTPNMPEIQANAIKCIARAAQSSDNCKLLHEHKVEELLVELLSVTDVRVKTAACQAVPAMRLQQASKDSFRDLGGVSAVADMLSGDSAALREAATQALSSLTHSNKLNQLAVYEAGGHEILVQQLYGSCPGTVANSAATLGNMAEQEVIHCSILSHGAMPALVEPLKSSNPQVLVSAARCLAALAIDTEARAKLQSAGGLQPLVNLLRSYNKEVLHNACLAVNVCAADEPTAVEMCKCGALERLQEINDSVTRRSSVSKLAMISLLNANVSVKYSLTGHLTSADIISDGFYDAGTARAGERILSLEELCKQPVNQHRPIICVNTAAEEEAADERQSNASETDRNTGSSRDRRRKKKEDDKQKDEPRPPSATEKAWKPMEDVSLQLLVKKAKESIRSLSDEGEQYAAVARLVSEAMGGAVEAGRLHEFPWVLHLSELKAQLQSNVVPVGLIRSGIYCHRALLFKCLVDCIGMSCTLVRGEYNRAWNEVLVFTESLSHPSHAGRPSRPRRCIVDLVHRPGDLLAANTPAAERYQTI